MYLNTSPTTFSTSLKGLECLKQSETIQLFTLDMVRHVVKTASVTMATKRMVDKALDCWWEP